MAVANDTDRTSHVTSTAVLVWLAVLTLTALVFIEQFAEVPPVLAAYLGAAYLLVGDD